MKPCYIVCLEFVLRNKQSLTYLHDTPKHRGRFSGPLNLIDFSTPLELDVEVECSSMTSSLLCVVDVDKHVMNDIHVCSKHQVLA